MKEQLLKTRFGVPALLLILLSASSVAASGYLGYLVWTGTRTTAVVEPISVSATSFATSIYPSGTTTFTVTITNAVGAPTYGMAYAITTDGTAIGVNYSYMLNGHTYMSGTTTPLAGGVTDNLVIYASAIPSAKPGTITVTVDVYRGA